MPDVTRILYMEDDAGLARLLQKRLQRAGFAVDIAIDGQEGLTKYQTNSYDVIIVDQRMPSREGIEVIRILAAEDDPPPVIMVTGTGNEPIAVEAMKLGAADYVVKDADGGYFELLPAVINKALYRQRLIEDNKQAETNLRISEARYRLLAENSLDLIALLDMEGHILYASPSHFRVLGFTLEELDHQNIFDIIHPADKQAVVEAATDLIETQEATKVEARLPKKSGAWINVEALLSIAAGHNDQTTQILVSARNITERKAAEEALKQYTVELQEHNQELDAFSHTVAHDLKSPLAQVVGISSLVISIFEDMSDEEVLQNLQSILDSGQRMNNIINELLLLASVRKQAVKTKPLNMERIVKNVKQRLAFMMEKQQTRLIEPAAWPVVVGYGPWVEEVWVNYISNAIKYGGRPPVVTLGADTQPDGRVCFWVQDNGAGMSLEEQSNLFIPFTRLSQVRAEGHGLGLSIVRRIIEKINGDVGLESEVGQGSTFYFILPTG